MRNRAYNSFEMAQAQFDDGRMNGEYRAFHPNGRVAELGNYANDEQHGVFQTWTPAGQPLTEEAFDMGVLKGMSKIWFENGTVCLLSAHGTRWWMNLREEGTPVSIEIARETVTGKARLWDGDSEALRERVRRYLTALPRDAKVYGIKLDESKRPVEESLAEVAPELVFVEVELD